MADYLTHFSCLLDVNGGGAHVIDLATADTIAWTSTEEWLAMVLDGGLPDA